jgi:hypothetical protein
MTINWIAVGQLSLAAGVIWSGIQAKIDRRQERRERKKDADEDRIERERVAQKLEQSTSVTAKKLDTIHVLVDGEYTTALFNYLQVLKELYAYTMKTSDWARVEAAQLVYDRHTAQQEVIHKLEMEKINAAVKP